MLRYFCNGKNGICDNEMLCNTCEFYGNGGRYLVNDENPYWKSICKLADEQRAKGIENYGQGLEDNPMTMLDRLTYLQEELIDGLMYIEHIKARLVELEEKK
jgi:hypothetical protein